MSILSEFLTKLGVQDDFCIQLCSELHDAIFAPVMTQGRNSGATAVDCEFPNSFLGNRSGKMDRFIAFAADSS
ncbi:MAG: hypothetical protein BECKG1743F_GA0114225_105433 [Candidatus Kentron sp. G]|nr:MAG: hypothetical protein BECKG1743F_GA0114225_105433 [Candidatus Kentron sp. G]VFN03916.1 MAG: hypothetical protein BECKG1743E_GA0114224_106712 [Candidatus Kentron sp. G]